MTLDPQAAMLLEAIKQLGSPDVSELDPEGARAMMAARRLPKGPDAHVRELQMPGPGGAIALRAYRPLATEQDTPLGGLVYFHGGGFVTGGLDSHDAVCRKLCADAQCAVVSVDYRLAPEHPFPAAVDDALAATVWVAENAAALRIDRARLAVGGDSAGANLATVVAALSTDRGAPSLRYQLLFYPVADLREVEPPSYEENAEGYFLTRRAMYWFRDHYVPRPEQRHDPRVSPLARSSLDGLPPAYVVTAEHDPLRDEGDAYARSLQAAGVPTTHRPYAGMIHAFVSMYSVLDQGRAAIEAAAVALRNALQP